MKYVVLATTVASWMAFAVLMLIPLAAVVTARRERAGRPHGWLTSRRVLVACALACVVSPLLASMLTPDWNPWTMLAIIGAAWATAGFSAVFIWSYGRGASASKAVAYGLLTACAAPALGVCGVIGGMVRGAF